MRKIFAVDAGVCAAAGVRSVKGLQAVLMIAPFIHNSIFLTPASILKCIIF
jgi:hypothetical protein